MATFLYLGRLTDFGERQFQDAFPRVWVSPQRAAFGPNGPLADRQVPAMVDADGNLAVRLTPSVETTPQTRYFLRCDWFTTEVNGQEVFAGSSEWEFVAAIGGGQIRDMALIPITRIWAGDQPPASPGPGLWWLDTSSYPYVWKEWV